MVAAMPYDAILAALDRAPLGEPLPAEVEAEVRRAEQDVRDGRVNLIPHADVQRFLASHREQG